MKRILNLFLLTACMFAAPFLFTSCEGFLSPGTSPAPVIQETQQSDDNSVSKSKKITITTIDLYGNEVKQEYSVETVSIWSFDDTILVPVSDNATTKSIGVPTGKVIETIDMIDVDSFKKTEVKTIVIENTNFRLIHKKDILTVPVDGKNKTFAGDDVSVYNVVADATKMTIEDTPNVIDGEDYYLVTQPVSLNIKIGGDTSLSKTFNQLYNLQASIYDVEIEDQRQIIKTIEKSGEQWLGVIKYIQVFALSGEKVTIPEKLILNADANGGHNQGQTMYMPTEWSVDSEFPSKGGSDQTITKYKQGNIDATYTHWDIMLCWVDVTYCPQMWETAGKVLINNEWIEYPYISVDISKFNKTKQLVSKDEKNTWEGFHRVYDIYEWKIITEFKYVNSETEEVLFTSTSESKVTTDYITKENPV